MKRKNTCRLYRKRPKTIWNKNEFKHVACLLAYACCTLVVHRPLTSVLHLVLFCDIRSRSCHLLPSISISAIRSLHQVFLGLPLPRFPCGFHCRACLVMLCFGFLNVCPIHLHFPLFNSSSTGGWLVFCQSSLLEIFSGLRQLLMNTWSFVYET